MSSVVPQQAFCFHCGNSVEGDIMEHVSTQHGHETAKPKVEVQSPGDRLNSIAQTVSGIRHETEITAQIQKVDEVLKELYLVRASLTQKKRLAAQKKGK
jgi:hypothetical protein